MYCNLNINFRKISANGKNRTEKELLEEGMMNESERYQATDHRIEIALVRSDRKEILAKYIYRKI